MKHGSLFSGIGGFDLAAEWMGWENVFHCEWNEFGQRVLKHYWPKAISYEDITKTDFTIHRGNIDILTGGFPCQPYSSAGKRLGKEDERHLWPQMLRTIREIKPRWVVGENVYGLVNWSNGLVFHEVQADLEAEGYEVQPYLLPAVSVNAPHRRDRIWFVAHAKSNGSTISKLEESESGQQIQTRSYIDRFEGLGSSSNPNKHTERPPRKSGSIEGNGSKGYLQQKQWGEKTEFNIGLHELSSNATNTNRNGQHISHSQHEINASEGRVNAQRDSQQSNGDGDATDTNSRRLEGSTKVGWHGINAEWEGEFGDVAYTNGIGLRRQGDGSGNAGFIGKNSKRSDWSNFPTVSPICLRDDGFSDRLDGITFPKWRNESIKAGGNAVVPQVVYQIFKTIEQYEILNNVHNPAY